MWWWYVLHTLWRFFYQYMRPLHTALVFMFLAIWQFALAECWTVLVTWASCSSCHRLSTTFHPAGASEGMVEGEGESERDRRNNGWRHETMRPQTSPSFPPAPRHCDHNVVLLQNSKRVSSNGGLRCSPMGTEDCSNWVIRRLWIQIDVSGFIVRYGYVWQMWDWLRKFISFIGYVF